MPLILRYNFSRCSCRSDGARVPCLLQAQQAAPPYPIPINQSIQSDPNTQGAGFLLVGLFATAQTSSTSAWSLHAYRLNSNARYRCALHILVPKKKGKEKEKRKVQSKKNKAIQ